MNSKTNALFIWTLMSHVVLIEAWNENIHYQTVKTVANWTGAMVGFVQQCPKRTYNYPYLVLYPEIGLRMLGLGWEKG